MLIRISLILAIIAGLAAAGLNFLQVKEKITTTIAERDQNAKDRDQNAKDRDVAKKLAKDTQSKLDKTSAELNTTKDERDQALATADAATKKAEGLSDTLKKTEQDRDVAQNELAQWHAVGITVGQIKAKLETIKAVSEERDTFKTENKLLLAENQRVQNELNIYKIPDFEPKMPEGLHGKILVADPKYDFVVLNIGEKQGVLEAGRFLVNRHGKLIAKLKVKSVQPDRCIANVMPGWKLGDVMEGDQVLY